MTSRAAGAERRLEQITKQLRNSPVSFANSDDAAARKALRSKSILVTGGASGLGEAFTRRLTNLGAFVLVADRDAERGLRLEKELTEKGRRCVSLQVAAPPQADDASGSIKFAACDVCSWESQVLAFKQAIASSPTHSLDHVIVNAGLRGNILRQKRGVTKDNEPQKPAVGSIDVNVVGGYYTSELALHYMKDSVRPRPKGETCSKSLLFIGSMASYRALVFATDYSAAKFGVRGMFKALRGAPGAAWGLRVNMLAPAYLLTPMTISRQKSIESLGFEFTDLKVVEDAAIKLMGVVELSGKRLICPLYPSLLIQSLC